MVHRFQMSLRYFFTPSNRCVAVATVAPYQADVVLRLELLVLRWSRGYSFITINRQPVFWF